MASYESRYRATLVNVMNTNVGNGIDSKYPLSRDYK